MKYKAGDKFVLTVTGLLGTEEEDSDKGLYKVEGLSGFATESGLDNMERLDSDYVNEYFGDLQDEAYNQGMSDAWELIKEIALHKEHGELRKIFEFFNINSFAELLENHTAREIQLKWAAYENEKDVVKVGDVIRHKENADLEILVTCLHVDGTFDGVMISKTSRCGKTGSAFVGRTAGYFVKTDKHFDIGSKMAELQEKKHE